MYWQSASTALCFLFSFSCLCWRFIFLMANRKCSCTRLVDCVWTGGRDARDTPSERHTRTKCEPSAQGTLTLTYWIAAVAVMILFGLKLKHSWVGSMKRCCFSLTFFWLSCPHFTSYITTPHELCDSGGLTHADSDSYLDWHKWLWHVDTG